MLFAIGQGRMHAWLVTTTLFTQNRPSPVSFRFAGLRGHWTTWVLVRRSWVAAVCMRFAGEIADIELCLV